MSDIFDILRICVFAVNNKTKTCAVCLVYTSLRRVSCVKVYNDQRINTHYILIALQTRKKKALYLFQHSFYVSLCMPSRPRTQSFQIQDHLEPLKNVPTITLDRHV